MIVRYYPAVLLVINGLLYLYVAWLFIIDPIVWFRALAIDLRSAAGYTELQSVYAGLLGALGFFFLLCAWQRQHQSAGILLMVISYTGLVVVRSYGILVEQAYNALILQIYITEWLALVLAVVAWFVGRRVG